MERSVGFYKTVDTIGHGPRPGSVIGGDLETGDWKVRPFSGHGRGQTTRVMVPVAALVGAGHDHAGFIFEGQLGHHVRDLGKVMHAAPVGNARDVAVFTGYALQVGHLFHLCPPLFDRAPDGALAHARRAATPRALPGPRARTC